MFKAFIIIVFIMLLSCVLLFAKSWIVAHQAPLFMESSRQEFWNRLPAPTLGDLLNSGLEPITPALVGNSLPLCHLGSDVFIIIRN